MCAAQCGRQLLSSPDVRIAKSERALGVLEDKRFTKEGAEFREHSLRQYAARGAAGVPHARARAPRLRILGARGFLMRRCPAQVPAQQVLPGDAGPQREALRRAAATRIRRRAAGCCAKQQKH
jgi:hypothetical protein